MKKEYLKLKVQYYLSLAREELYRQDELNEQGAEFGDIDAIFEEMEKVESLILKAIDN